MRKLLLVAALCTGQAAAGETLITSSVSDFSTVLSEKPRYDDVKLNWVLRLRTTNDAVATGELIAVPIVGKRYTRAVGVTAKMTPAQASATNNLIDMAAQLGRVCMGMRQPEILNWDTWVRSTLGGGQLGTFEHVFAPATARLVLADTYPSARLTLTFVRNGNPGASNWPNYCTVR